MNWTNTAILSAAILGMVNIFDSHLVSKRLPSFRVFLLLLGSVHLIYGLILLYLFPLPEDTGWLPIVAAVVSGIFRTTAATIMLYSMKSAEVSRVIPIVYTSPIFVALLAIPLLGENLNYLQWLAIIIVVSGAVVISIEKGSFLSEKWLGSTFLLPMVSSILFATADIISKYALSYLSFWNLFYISAFCMSGLWLPFSMHPSVLRQIRYMNKRNSAIALLSCNELMAAIGITLSFRAIANGPVSLASTVIASRPIFVAVYAIIMSRVLPGFLMRSADKRALALRLMATVMIVSGISIIYLN